jgi:hypothetical protein
MRPERVLNTMDLLEFGSITVEKIDDEFIVSDGDNAVKVSESGLMAAFEAALKSLIEGKL